MVIFGENRDDIHTSFDLLKDFSCESRKGMAKLEIVCLAPKRFVEEFKVRTHLVKTRSGPEDK